MSMVFRRPPRQRRALMALLVVFLLVGLNLPILNGVATAGAQQAPPVGGPPATGTLKVPPDAVPPPAPGESRQKDAYAADPPPAPADPKALPPSGSQPAAGFPTILDRGLDGAEHAQGATMILTYAVQPGATPQQVVLRSAIRRS